MTLIEPAPVEVTNTEPMPVTFDPPVATPAQTRARSTALSARVDADILRTEDQRRISGMWERTQQIIALSVVEVSLIVVALLVLAPTLVRAMGHEVTAEGTTAAVAGLLFLTGVANLVIGFYFGRTNHQRVGGVDRDDYLGR